MKTLLIVTLAGLSLASNAHAADGIAIKGSSSDRGIKLTINRKTNSITLRGAAHGPTTPKDEFGIPRLYSIAHGVGFTLDINKVSTTDALGRTNYTLKNRRLFGVDTSRGWDAREIADRLSVKVNALPDFIAQVTHHRDGSATLRFDKR